MVNQKRGLTDTITCPATGDPRVPNNITVNLKQKKNTSVHVTRVSKAQKEAPAPTNQN